LFFGFIDFIHVLLSNSVRYLGASSWTFAASFCCVFLSSSGGASSALPLAVQFPEKTFAAPPESKGTTSARLCCEIGAAHSPEYSPHHRRALSTCCLGKSVPTRLPAAQRSVRRHMHINQTKTSIRVIAGEQNGVRISHNSEVRNLLMVSLRQYKSASQIIRGNL
jgi:hypothetical protein